MGFIFHKKLGDEVKEGDAILTVYYNDDAGLESAFKRFERSIEISADAQSFEAPALIKEVRGA